ncbi:hypothetical protein ACTHUD_16705 [Neisseria sp. P0016.S002]
MNKGRLNIFQTAFSFLLAKTFIAGYADTVLDSAATLLKLLIQEKKTLST